MENRITWAQTPPRIVFEDHEVIKANTPAHFYSDDVLGFAVLDGALSVSDRERRVWRVQGNGIPVWSASVRPNQESTRVSVWSRFLNFLWSNQQ